MKPALPRVLPVPMTLMAMMTIAMMLPAQAQPSPGRATFEKICAACHQADASGTVGLAPPLRGAHWARLGRSADYVATVILKGLAGRIEIEGRPFIGAMPSFAGQFDDAQIAGIITHLRTLQGLPDTAVSADDVGHLRATPGNPAQTRELRQRLLQVP